MNIVAFIPARAGSQRVLHKNMRPLNGKPLIAWTIAAAQASEVFSDIQIWTDDPAVHMWAAENTPVRTYQRDPSGDHEPDIVWVKTALKHQTASYNAFSILRPTSPFRTGETIQRAWKEFKSSEVHSLRAVEPVKQHPGKMWTWKGPGYPIEPLLKEVRVTASYPELKTQHTTPWHSLPTQTLPKVFVQNASLEIAWTYVVESFGTISGTKISPFFTQGHEGFDINDEEDWREAERIAHGQNT